MLFVRSGRPAEFTGGHGKLQNGPRRGQDLQAERPPGRTPNEKSLTEPPGTEFLIILVKGTVRGISLVTFGSSTVPFEALMAIFGSSGHHSTSEGRIAFVRSHESSVARPVQIFGHFWHWRLRAAF